MATGSDPWTEPERVPEEVNPSTCSWTDVMGRTRWATATMPSPAVVRRVMAPLLEFYDSDRYQYALFITSVAAGGRGLAPPTTIGTVADEDLSPTAEEAGTWFDLSLGTSGFYASTGWATPFSDRELRLAEHACRLLGGKLVGLLVLAAMDQWSRAYDAMTAAQRAEAAVPGWGPGVHRGTLDRLLDRVHLNHAFFAFSDLPGVGGTDDTQVAYRVGSWYRVEGRQDRLTKTRFARLGADNRWMRVRDRMVGSGASGLLGLAFGLHAGPTDLALPLDWSEAGTSGLGTGDLGIRLDHVDPDDTLRDAMRSLGEALEITWDDFDMSSGEQVPSQTADEARLSFFTRLENFHLRTVPAMVGAMASYLVASATVEPWFRPLRDALFEVANGGDVPLNEVLAVLIEGIAGLRDRSLLTYGVPIASVLHEVIDLDDGDFWSLAFLLHPRRYLGELPNTVPADFAVPIVLLGDEFAAVAELFGPEANFGWDDAAYDPESLKILNFYATGTGSLTVLADQDDADRWIAWWNAARPCVDAACVFDSAGRIVEQLLYLDDGLLALNPLAASEGVVGEIVREAVGSVQLQWMLHGVPPGRLVRFLLRQVLTDYFLGQVDDVVSDGSRDCLYAIFCWMDTQEKRDTLDEVLGEVSIRSLSAGAASATGLETFHLRAFLEWVERAASGSTTAGVSDGALARVLSAALEATDDEPFDKRVDPCDLARIRTWLHQASESCLANLEARLRPEFLTSNAYMRRVAVERRRWIREV